MHRKFQNSVLIVVVLWICCATLPAAEEVTEKYPDGAKKAVYSVNAAGMKHGNYDEFFSNGKRKIQARYVNGKLYGPYKSFFENGRNHIRAAYKADELTGKYSEYAEQGGIARSAIYGEGKLDGPYQEFTKGVLVKDQSFLKGRLLVPKSAKLITATLGAISTMRIQTVGEIPANANRKYQAALADPLLQKEREDALRTLMAYRYLCDVPFQDLVLDRSFIVCTEAGCDLLQRVGSLQHTPPNPGMAAEDYKLGFSGTKSSNLHIGQKSMTDAVRGFMDDSDPGNIDRLGHRRWCLNPKMAKTAFARQGKFSAMWAVDGSRSKVPNYEFVAFPPPGFTPTVMFKKDWAWNVTLNPKKYRKPTETVKVAIYPIRFIPTKRTLQKAPRPLLLNYRNLESHCIIFRPADVQVVPNATYWVEIQGLQDAQGEETTADYLVAFF